MRIDKGHSVKLKITAEDIRCFLVVGDAVWCGLRNGTIQILESKTGKLIKRGEGKLASINALALTDSTVWSGSSDGTIGLWKSHNGELIKKTKAHASAVTCLLAEGDTIWSGSNDFSIKVWNKETLKNTGLLKGHRNQVKCLLWLNGSLWSGADDCTILVWSESGEKRKLEGHKAPVLCLLHVNNTVWSASADKSIMVWDAETLQLVKELRGHTNWVSWMFTMGPDEVWSGSIDKRVVAWNINDYNFQELLVEDGITYLLKPDDSRVWIYSQAKKTLTIYPVVGDNVELNVNANRPGSSDGRPASRGRSGSLSGRPGSRNGSRPSSPAPATRSSRLAVERTGGSDSENSDSEYTTPTPRSARSRLPTSAGSGNLTARSAEKRKQVLEQLAALKRTVATESKSPRAQASKTAAKPPFTPKGPLSARSRLAPALPSTKPKTTLDPRMLIEHQLEEMKDKLQDALGAKAILEQECQELLDQIRGTPDLRPELEKRESILSKERQEWAQERARYEGEAKALKITLEEETTDRVAKVRELAAMRQEWESQAKRLQANATSLKKLLEEKTKAAEDEERKTKAAERMLLSVEAQLNARTQECLESAEKIKSAEGRMKMKKLSLERKLKDSEDDLKNETIMRDKLQTKCSELESENSELSLEVTKLTRKLQKAKKKLTTATETLLVKEREMEAEKDRTLKQTQSLLNKVDETKLGVAAWLESSRNELEFANYTLSEKSDVLEKEKKNLEKYVAVMKSNWEASETQVEATKMELRKLNEENFRLNEELVKLRGKLVQETKKATPSTLTIPAGSPRSPNSARNHTLTRTLSHDRRLGSSPRETPTIKSQSSKTIGNAPLSPKAPISPKSSPLFANVARQLEKQQGGGSDIEDDEDENKSSMFFFENYHKINEEHENLKKKMETEQRIKQEMKNQLEEFEQKLKEMETMRNEAHKNSITRASQHSEEMRALMEQLAASEEKVEKLEKQKEELTQIVKATPPVTPHSLTTSLSGNLNSSRPQLNIDIPSSSQSSFTKNSPHFLSRSSSVSSTKSLLTPISTPSSPRFDDDLELEDYTDESEYEEEEPTEEAGDLMAYLSQLQATLTHLSNDIIDEFDESSQLRQQHYNSMKQISEEKQELSKEKSALEWKMLLMKRRLHQQELDNEKTKGIDLAKAKEWDKLTRDKEDEKAELEEKIREERKDWEEEEEKSRRKITNLELDLEELRKDNVKLKEQVERALVRRGHDTSDGIPMDGLTRSTSDKSINNRIKNEGRKRSNTQVL